MGPKKAAVVTTENTCRFCFLELDNEFYLGKKHKLDGITAHYNCLLFACGLQQNGADEEGIYGFLEQDIRKELTRASKLRCNYCKLKGAATGCLLKKCRATYHFPCGLINYSLCQFFGTFGSLCRKHRPRDPELVKQYYSLADEMCNICWDNLFKSDNYCIDLDMSERNDKISAEPLGTDEFYFRLIYTACCKKWLHFNCVQRQALNAGMYFVKCPLCNDRDTFVEQLAHDGVYIPEKDASWEETAAFHDLERRYEHCDAEECCCPKGRTHGEEFGDWELIICYICGSSGVHLGCIRPPPEEVDDGEWSCQYCTVFERRYNEGRKLKSETLTDSGVQSKPRPEHHQQEKVQEYSGNGNAQSTSARTCHDDQDKGTDTGSGANANVITGTDKTDNGNDNQVDQETASASASVLQSKNKFLLQLQLQSQSCSSFNSTTTSPSPSASQSSSASFSNGKPIKRELSIQDDLDQSSNSNLNSSSNFDSCSNSDVNLVPVPANNTNDSTETNSETVSNRRRSRSPAINRLQDENLPFRKRRLKFYESFNLRCQVNQDNKKKGKIKEESTSQVSNPSDEVDQHIPSRPPNELEAQQTQDQVQQQTGHILHAQVVRQDEQYQELYPHRIRLQLLPQIRVHVQQDLEESNQESEPEVEEEQE